MRVRVRARLGARARAIGDMCWVIWCRSRSRWRRMPVWPGGESRERVRVGRAAAAACVHARTDTRCDLLRASMLLCSPRCTAR